MPTYFTTVSGTNTQMTQASFQLSPGFGSGSGSEREVDEEAYHNWVRSQPNYSEMHREALRTRKIPQCFNSSCSDSETEERVAKYDE
jgi:hypothetical protein